MRWLVAFLLVLCAPAIAQDVRTYVPRAANIIMPELIAVQYRIWPSAPQPWTIAGQIEQESCISLTHSKCWNPRAELKTSRENGFGLGQTTVAYRADGSIRFDKQAELRAQYSTLRGWTWERRYEPGYQLIAVVEMDRGIYTRLVAAQSEIDRLSFTLSAYNGGESGVRQDRLLCSNTRGCNPGIWLGNVEHTSLKTRVANKGYGASAFQINREYVTNVLYLRRPKYEQFFKVGH